MGGWILEVVNVGFHVYAIDSVDRAPVLLMKRELHVCFAKLFLLETTRCIPVQCEIAGGLDIKFSLLRGQPDLVYQRRVSVAENPVRRESGKIESLEIVQRGFLRQRDLLHRSCNI